MRGPRRLRPPPGAVRSARRLLPRAVHSSPGHAAATLYCFAVVRSLEGECCLALLDLGLCECCVALAMGFVSAVSTFCECCFALIFSECCLALAMSDFSAVSARYARHFRSSGSAPSKSG